MAVTGEAISKRLEQLASKRSELHAARSQLPAYQHRESVLAMIKANRVTVIRGATGCGKSTQLPQLLLESSAAEHAGACNIIVAQPRRLAATALAERVSSELGEAAVGGLCGYRIRGDSKVGGSTALTYVTTGVLLRMLEEDLSLAFATHIVVDEVHERSADTDLLLLVLRRALRATEHGAKILSERRSKEILRQASSSRGW